LAEHAASAGEAGQRGATRGHPVANSRRREPNLGRSSSLEALHALSARRLAAVDLRSSLSRAPLDRTWAWVSPLDRKRAPALLLAFILLAAAVAVQGNFHAGATPVIAFRGATSGANGDRRTLNLKTPLGAQPGDLMLAGLFDDDSPGILPPSGWKLVRHDGHGTIFYRFATDTEPASHLWRFSRSSAVAGAIVAYSGVGSPPVSASGGRRNGESHWITTPSLYVDEQGAVIVGFFGIRRRTNIDRPSGMKRRALRRSWAGPAVALQVADSVRDVGLTGRRAAWSGRSGPNVGQLVILKPYKKPPPSPPPSPSPSPPPSPSPSPPPSPSPSPPPPDPGLNVQALDSASARVAWTAPEGTARIRIFRDDRLIDEFAAGDLSTYTDHLLWRNTPYRYEVRFLDSASNVLGAPSGSVTTPSPSGPFPRLYADTSFWNQPIGADPALEPNSSQIVSKALVSYDGNSNLAKSDAWGIPIAYADSNSTLYSIGCSRYGCDKEVSIRIPRYAKPTTGSDHHLVVVDPMQHEADMWIALYDPDKDSWTAGSRYGTRADGWGALCFPHERCSAAVAAGFAEPGGIIRPEEIDQGHIDHALVISTPYTRSGFIACPATHTDGKYSDPAAIPEGARVQLDPDFDVDAQPWPRWQKVVARALQSYGAFVADTGGSLAVRGEPNLDRGYDAWAKAGVGSSSLSFLPWGRFRVLKLEAC
jgi:hypothetical protein